MSAAKILHKNNAVYACVVRERETNVQVWSADVDDHSATNTGTRSQASKRTHDQTHAYTNKPTKSKCGVPGSGLGNRAITVYTAGCQTGCQTRLTTGMTTGWMFVYTI